MTVAERIAICPTIPGYSGQKMLGQLYESARDAEPDGANIEIGCLFGRSSVAISYGLEDRNKGDILTCIDPFESWEGEKALESYLAQFEDPRDLFLKNVAEAGCTIELIVGRSQERAIQNRIQGPVRFAFIDGDHRTDQVRADVEWLLPLMAPGGIMAFDDYGHNRGTWGVAEVADALVAPVSERMFTDDPSPGLAVFRIGGGE